MPLLRLPNAGADRMSRVPVRRHPLPRPGHAEARSRGARPGFPIIAACGWTPTRCRSPAATSGRLAPFRDGAVRILVGTQMIAKGLDFPNVTLVGVVNADTALHLPDFRAAERTFQLRHASGRPHRPRRTGRRACWCKRSIPNIRRSGRRAARLHRLRRSELPIRQALDYPPFGSMIRIVVRGPKQIDAEGFAEQIANNTRAALASAEFKWRVPRPRPRPHQPHPRQPPLPNPSPSHRPPGVEPSHPSSHPKPLPAQPSPMDHRRRSVEHAVNKKGVISGRSGRGLTGSTCCAIVRPRPDLRFDRRASSKKSPPRQGGRKLRLEIFPHSAILHAADWA